VNAVIALIPRVARFVLALFRSLFRWVTRRPDVSSDAVGFAYVGALALLLWVLIVVSAIELVGLHLILPWAAVRMVADTLGLVVLVWLLGQLASFSVYPHLATGSGLRIRNGAAIDITVPWDSIAAIGVRERSCDGRRTLHVDRDEQGSVLSVVMAGRTNVDVTLRCPLVVPVGKGEEPVMALRLYADDARGLVSRVKEQLATRSAAGQP
jgi:hypothetical protein